MKVLLIGMNHRSAPVELRERFAVGDLGPALEKLADSSEIEEVAILSTCNRVEVVATVSNFDAARHRVIRFFGSEWQPDVALPSASPIEDHLYVHRDGDAISHLFRVTSALDSMVVGEPQILGQVKEAYRLAVDAGVSGPILSRLFQRAFATAKRVRSETRIAEGPVSVARIGVELVGQVFEDLGSKQGLLIGAGEMVEAALVALQGHGLQRAVIANRTLEHAEELAARFGVEAAGLSDLPSILSGSDIVLSSIGGEGPILTREVMESALQKRRGRPMVVIDIGVPRNVASDVDDLESVYLYNIDDLQGIAVSNTEHREREAILADRIVLAEQERFEGWLGALQSVPTIRDLTGRAESLRRAELDRSLDRLGLDEQQREGVEVLTRSLVQKLLHFPVRRLRSEADRDEALAMLEAARVLFGLDETVEGDDMAGDSAIDDAPDSTEET